MTQVLTRRSFVSATVPAAVLTASVSTAAANRFHGPDAELLQLAEEFERLHDQWQGLDEEARRLAPPSAAAYAVAGAMDELWNERKQSGYDAAVIAASDKVDELDVVANRMRAIVPRTIQGLAMKARLTQFDTNLSIRSDMAGPEVDWDWDVKCMEHFVREIERFAQAQALGGLNG